MNNIEIIKIREELGLTQQNFADLIGVDRRTVINYEQGKKIPESKTKLLNLLLESKRTETKSVSSLGKTENNSVISMDNLNREILDLKDHIQTLKDFLEEKTTVAEFYKAENKRLREEISSVYKQ